MKTGGLGTPLRAGLVQLREAVGPHPKLAQITQM